MRPGWISVGVVVGLALLAGSLPVGARETVARHTAMTTTGETSVPYGWVDFCGRYAGECSGGAASPLDVALSAKALRDIERIDRTVNAAVSPVTDSDHWGVVDRWDYPTDGKGDCEDYALEKRRLLMAAGYPRQALLMTVVKDHAGEGHAVLTVKSDHGDYVLDNMVDAVLPWDETGYRFIKRQSQADPNIWVSIGPAVSAPLYTAR